MREQVDFMSRVLEYFKDCIEANPRWLSNVYAQVVMQALEHLRAQIEDPANEEVNWQRPLVEIAAVIPFDVSLRPTIRLTTADRESIGDYAASFLDSSLDLMKMGLIAANPGQYTVIEGDESKLVDGPTPVPAPLVLEKSAAKRLRSNTVSFRWKDGLGWKLTVRVLPLTMDHNRNKVFVPIRVQLRFWKGDPAKEPELQNAVWSTTTNALAAAMPEGYQPPMEKYMPEDTDTFAMPSDVQVMKPVLGAFAGRQKHTPQKALQTPKAQRTADQQQKISRVVESVLRVQRISDFDSDNQYSFAVIHPWLKRELRVSVEVDERDPESWIYAARTVLNARGLRHLFGVMIGLEDNGRRGTLHWRVNDHMKRLGYRRDPGGAFNSRLKQRISDEVALVLSLKLEFKKKGGGTLSMRLFNTEVKARDKGADGHQYATEMTVTTTRWYRKAFEEKQRYTQILKRLVTESHTKHWVSLILGGVLPMYWRIEDSKKLTVAFLMGICGMNTHDQHRFENLRKLEQELDYMQSRGYLGGWNHDSDGPTLSESTDPFKTKLELSPPTWLQKAFARLQERRRTARIEAAGGDLTPAQLKRVQQQSGMTVADFAEQLGISRAWYYRLLKGDGEIPHHLAQKACLLTDDKF